MARLSSTPRNFSNAFSHVEKIHLPWAPDCWALPVESGSVPTANVCEVCGLLHETGWEVLLGRSVSAGASAVARSQLRGRGLVCHGLRLQGCGAGHEHHRSEQGQHERPPPPGVYDEARAVPPRRSW